MTITLISETEYETLLRIQKDHPILTYQNKDYDNFDRSKMTEEDKEAFQIVTNILKKNIVGFSKFQNFKLSTKGEIKLRFQYDYDADIEYEKRGTVFIGVGYLFLDELRDGFRNKDEDLVER